MFLLFFESIPEFERTSVLTTYNLGHAMATVVGSLIGGLMLAVMGKSPGVYLSIFCVSSAARLATVALLTRVPETASQPIVLGRRILGIRPALGSLDRPIMAGPATETAATEAKPLIATGAAVERMTGMQQPVLGLELGPLADCQPCASEAS
jgi:MFS family permease